MGEMETTCLDYIMRCGIRGMEDDIVKQYYLERGASQEHVDNAVKAVETLETVGEMKYEGVI